MGWTAGVQFPVGARDFSLLHSVQTNAGAHPASYPMRIGTVSPGIKWPLCEADHSPPSSSKVKNGGAATLPCHTSSWLGA
jgi:hypothetical protein